MTESAQNKTCLQVIYNNFFLFGQKWLLSSHNKGALFISVNKDGSLVFRLPVPE